MKDYSSVNTENWRELLTQLKEEVNEELKGTKLTCGKFIDFKLTYINGEISEVSDILLHNCKPDIMIQVRFENGMVSSYSLNRCACMPGFKMSDEKMEYIKTAFETVASILIYDHIEKEELFQKEHEAQKKIVEDSKKAERDKKRLEKLRNHRAELLKGLDSIKATVHDEPGFYVSLGYIAKHIGTISATIPSWAEAWFIKRFGTAEKKVIDETKKTVSGFSMKFAPSFSVSLKKAENVPADVQALVDTSKKSFKINNTEFVFSLIDNYGFKFGKEQNIEDIKKTIPNNYITNFNKGYEMA